MLTIDDCSSNVEILKNSINQDWLHTEFEKIENYFKTPKNTRVLGEPENYLNTLAFLIYRAENQIREFRKSSKSGIPNEIVDATKLGIYIQTLQDNKIEGNNEKIIELINADNKLFEKLIFEFDIASSLLRANHKVKFLKTKSDDKERTPDLLIDENIEVECKKKDKLTKRDIRNHDYWGTLHRKLIELMNSKGEFYFVYVFFENDPSSNSLKKIVKSIRTLINQNKVGQFQGENSTVILHKICKKDEIIPLGINASTPDELTGQISNDPKIVDRIISQRIPTPELLDYDKIQPDFDVTDQEIRHQPNGDVDMKGLMKFIFKTKEIPDRLKSVIHSIRDAGNQLSGERCGLICVNMTHLTDKLMQQDYERLGKLIQNVLQNNTTISAVAITSEFYQKDPNGIRFLHKAEVMRNKFAKIPLPDDFVFLNPSI